MKIGTRLIMIKWLEKVQGGFCPITLIPYFKYYQHSILNIVGTSGDFLRFQKGSGIVLITKNNTSSGWDFKWVLSIWMIGTKYRHHIYQLNGALEFWHTFMVVRL